MVLIVIYGKEEYYLSVVHVNIYLFNTLYSYF
jgi:hypothetical protein